VFANRTLNLGAIKAIGCDMDYTLIHYHHALWEQRAYDHVQRRMVEAGLPVEDLRFDPDLVVRGLILDLSLGNIVKANRFGYVTRATHGTRTLDHAAQRQAYSRVLVDLSDSRWVFLNTLFSLSEACLYAQLIDLLDAGKLEKRIGYRDAYELVRAHINVAHMEGHLKQDIVADPDAFVDTDPELPLALLDLKDAGKRLLLITNSEWCYTRSMMQYAFDPHLPRGMKWRDLFEIVVVEARKPGFFTHDQPLFEIVDEEHGLLRPSIDGLRAGGVYLGGNARQVEKYLGVPGEDILYIGDHVYADVHVSKDVLRWRTALVIRELEHELDAADQFDEQQRTLSRLMQEKQRLEHAFATLRLRSQRGESSIGQEMQSIRTQLLQLDSEIAPLARQAGELGSRRWGPLLYAGNDKSRLARQLERYADIYMSRVSNLLHATPFAYFRAPRGTLPHDD